MQIRYEDRGLNGADPQLARAVQKRVDESLWHVRSRGNVARAIVGELVACGICTPHDAVQTAAAIKNLLGRRLDT